ncbi:MULTISPECIES: pseudaminic acid cytidylyltransferase [Rhodopirellula]|uniref:pseudaminic acid cytidylyltransferase n=1 Tax=Rhodopirellula TaxID=265488 RepID=UPI0025799352|nr:pseudaminic acid cytidylyltransferase [Rhodopirellula sp. UBA1907]
MIIAVIPARGGSKRLPGKNIRDFCGQPIIKYSITAAIDSGVFDRVIVTTDSQEIGDVAKACGAEIPFHRPAELSDDHTPTIAVIRHAVETLQQSGDAVDFACCIYATAPFVQSDDLKQGLKQLQSGDGEFAFPVTTFPFPIMRSLKIDDDQIKMIWPEHEMSRSQDLVEAWHDAGQFYWGTSEAWKTASGLYSANCLPIRIPRWRVQDIDTEEDWNRAQLMHQALCGKPGS